jgi:uncharacterized protein YjbI with pentapeptide repeats
MRYAQLQGADLSDAVLDQADLRGADFTEAKIGNISLKAAEIAGAIGLVQKR